MKLKWTMNGVTFNRSNYRPVIARFDNNTESQIVTTA